MSAEEQSAPFPLLPGGLLLLALLSYLLPWFAAPSAAMTLNAWDLAEWTSLHPSQHVAAPPLITPLLLRVQLPIFSLLLCLICRPRAQRGLAIAGVLALALAQLPPLEFARELGDPNYRQQFALAIVSIVVSALSWRFLPRRFAPLMMGGLAALAILCAIIGLSQARSLLHLTWQEGEAGAGLVILILAMAGILIASLRAR